MHYLLQAGQGQFELLNRARPINEVLQNEKTSPRLKRLLSEIEPIKKYGEKRGLKPTSNYQEFAQLNRKAAVWVVSACQPLFFQSKEWSFPIVGNFPFLGWFDYDNAVAFAETIRKQEGLDVDVRPASAYSTLGWFRDPLLSTMISNQEDAFGSLVNVILHESVHATLYIKNQAYLNESIASYIADHLTVDYLDHTKGPDSAEKKAYLSLGKRSKEVFRRFHIAYEKLDRLYRGPGSDEEKYEAKKKILELLRKDLSISREINNATLVQYKTYHSGAAELGLLFKCSQENWTIFLDHLRSIKDSAFGRANQADLHLVLQSLLQQACPSSLN